MENTKPRSVLGIAFLTVFLDVVGFSIIFPFFPAMLEHYLAVEGPASWFGRLAAELTELTARDEFASLVLFGGALGSIYSVLQFLFAPVWGGLSDRIGRRPTLLVTLTGTLAGYALWVFSGSIALLILARLIGGIAAGNISTATAVVADTTEGRDRAKGMGIIGVAIGLGFIGGPAIGGIVWSATGDPEGTWERGLALNPFSAPALAACVLAALNLAWVAARFRETLAPRERGTSRRAHVLNPFKQLQRIAFPGVTRTNFVYFFYLTAFSAMEFTLTFLAVERLGFGPTDNTWMFVFVGLVIAFVQGGVVRRLVPRKGEKSVALQGLVLLVPGFLCIAWAGSAPVLYVGLFLMAVGSALAMPCLSSLVSRYTPSDRQGLVLGTFRSMGSLARAVGPILGGLLYWKLGSAAPYLAGAVFLLLPLALATKLPPLAPETPPGAA